VLLGVKENDPERFAVERKRISEHSSAIARGLSIVSDSRSSRKTTAPIRRELTSCTRLLIGLDPGSATSAPPGSAGVNRASRSLNTMSKGSLTLYLQNMVSAVAKLPFS
jgi:hypothetical protein